MLEEVPPNSTVVGVPGRVVKQDNIKLPRNDMDQIHLPDPVKNDLQYLKEQLELSLNRIEELEEEVAKIKTIK